MPIADLHQTPRAAYEALAGKRTDLLLTPANGQPIFSGSGPIGECSLILGIWAATPDVLPHIVIVGGIN